MKRKIFEKQEVDLQTGEIIKTTSHYSYGNAETFFMGRTTEGLEWLFDFNNLTEIQLLILMIELENPKNNNIITFTGLQVSETAKILGVSEILIKKSIANLIKANFLKRVARANYIANPLCFYKGNSSSLIKRLEFYNNIDKIRESSFENEPNILNSKSL